LQHKYTAYFEKIMVAVSIIICTFVANSRLSHLGRSLKPPAEKGGKLEFLSSYNFLLMIKNTILLKGLLFAIPVILFSGLLLSCNQIPDTNSAKYYRKRIKSEVTDNKRLESKIDSIMSLMTIEEKAGQMLHINLGGVSAFDTLDFNQNFNINRMKEITRKYGIGFIFNDILLPADKWVEYNRNFQKLYLEETRLKIPYIHATCHQHGATYVDNATILSYPEKS
jgi:hypothetical protein